MALNKNRRNHDLFSLQGTDSSVNNWLDKIKKISGVEMVCTLDPIYTWYGNGLSNGSLTVKLSFMLDKVCYNKVQETKTK